MADGRGKGLRATEQITLAEAHAELGEHVRLRLGLHGHGQDRATDPGRERHDASDDSPGGHARARDREGDCKAHALYLAALALGRLAGFDFQSLGAFFFFVALGFFFLPPLQVFFYFF